MESSPLGSSAMASIGAPTYEDSWMGGHDKRRGGGGMSGGRYVPTLVGGGGGGTNHL